MARNKTTARKAVIVAGIRTPFVKAFTKFTKLNAIDLGVAAVEALLQKTGVPRQELDQLIWGTVIIPSASPNVAREISLDLRLPPHVQGHTCIQACVSGLQAITSAAASIERGDADAIVAGGSDSTSNAEIKLPQKVVHALAPMAFGKASPADMMGVLAQLWPIHELMPQKPEIAERTTGLSMGQSAEEMARRNEITRQAQDAFAERSHLRAAAAMESGRFDEEVTPVTTPEGVTVSTDGLVRGDTSAEKLSRLRPVFARNGTLTAGNSSPLTDGAAAVLVMEEEKARSLGFTGLVRLTNWAYVGVDPADQLLMGPALAMPKVLDKTHYGLEDMDIVDIHEAFAAQVLCVTKMLESRAFAQARLGRDEAVGEVDPDKLNVHGGSVSIGHPFGATGARMVNTMANELRITGKRRALLGLCAAGGIGGAALLERLED